jgi:putative SOS response-associated peptidase YedK
MCYSIAQVLKARDLEERFPARFVNAERFQPFYYASAFNRPLLPVIASDDNRRIQLLNWGLVPSWVKSAPEADSISLKTINARSETVFDKPAFRQSARERRCLVLASGFYEWRAFGGRKYPYFIWVKDSLAFAMAGIWDTWTDQTTGEVRRTFSILTTSANPLLEEIHNLKKRMPVILAKDLEMGWLSGGQSPEDLIRYLEPFPSNLMKAHPVTRAITRSGAQPYGAETILRVDYPELPLLRALQ